MNKITKKPPYGGVNKTENGYAVLELLFYIAFFALLSLLVINSMITMAQSFRETEVQTELLRSGNIMERISREIHQADSINLISATSRLKLNTTDDQGTAKIVEFRLLEPNLQLWEDDVLIGNLNTSNIIVSGITFTEITTIKSKAVKIILTVRAISDKHNRDEEFYDTIVLRGSY